MKDNSGKFILFGSIGCLLGIACCLGVVILGFGGLAWLGLQEPEGVNIIGEVPSRANVGETFSITVTIENVGVDPQSLNSIDFDSSYLEGVYVISSRPTFVDRENMSVFGYDFESFEFLETIHSGDQLMVKFLVEPLKVGGFEGFIDVCINTGSLCKSLPAYTVIAE